MDDWVRRQIDDQARRQQEAAQQAADLARRNAERSAEVARQSYDYWFSPAGGFFPTMDRQMEAARRRAEEMRLVSEESFRRSQELNARIAEQQRMEALARSQEWGRDTVPLPGDDAFTDAGTRQDQLLRSLSESDRLQDHAPPNPGGLDQLHDEAELAPKRRLRADADRAEGLNGELQRVGEPTDDLDRDGGLSRSNSEAMRRGTNEGMELSVAASQQKENRRNEADSTEDVQLRALAAVNRLEGSEDAPDGFPRLAEANQEAYDYWFNPNFGFFPTMERQMERARARAEELRSAAEEAFARAEELSAQSAERQRRAIEIAASADRFGLGKFGTSQDALVALSRAFSANGPGVEPESMQRPSEAAAREDYKYWFDPNMGFFPTMERQMERARHRSEELRRVVDDAFRESQLLAGESGRAPDQSQRGGSLVETERENTADSTRTEVGAQVRPTGGPAGEAVEPADLARYAAAYNAPFSQSESLQELWTKACADLPDTRSGYDQARNRFWQEIREGSSAAAVEAASMLSAAGFEFVSESGAPELRSIEPLALKHRRLSIDHAVPGSKEAGRWLDAANLRFMFEGDNVERNSFFDGKDQPYKGWKWHWGRKSLRHHE